MAVAITLYIACRPQESGVAFGARFACPEALKDILKACALSISIEPVVAFAVAGARIAGPSEARGLAREVGPAWCALVARAASLAPTPMAVDGVSEANTVVREGVAALTF